MEDRQKNTAPQGEECGGSTCRLCGFAPFIVGLVVALVFGWWLFPELMFGKQQQPVTFSHEVHVTEAALDCSQCHYLRADGTYSALPTTADCAVCHAQLMGKTPEELHFYKEYVQKGQEVKWLVYQKQPDNVFFSHAAHSLATCNTCHEYSEKELCSFCHLSMVKKHEYRENRLTGYSKNTMKMWQCEECHANPNHLGITNANNACFVCHK